MQKPQNTNNKLSLVDRVICRTPVFTLNDECITKFEELKVLIKDASPEFHKLVGSLNLNDVNNINQKAFYTVWKYFNRAKYRATPFGGFAGFTLLSLGKTELNITLNDRLLTHCLTDWDKKVAFNDDPQFVVNCSTSFRSNSTCYIIGRQLRYVKKVNDQFQIDAVEVFAELTMILDYCKSRRLKDDLILKVQNQFKLNKKSVVKLLVTLTACQLLWYDTMPNLIGEDYFKRIPIAQDRESNVHYLISERTSIKGDFFDERVKHLPEMIHFLNRNLPFIEKHDLMAFRSAFIKKFDQQTVPLAVVIDSEIGIGYANLGTHTVSDNLQDVYQHFQAGNIKEKFPKLYLTPLFQYILNESIKSRVIELENFKENNTPLEMALPNSFSVIYHSSNNGPVIEHIGGATATALLARFTISSKELETLCHDLVKIEQEANPDVIFFDIGYCAEKHVDNINRRKHLYPQELPLNVWSTLANPLSLDNIMVSVRRNEIILSCNITGKRIIPRLSSAYNYNRSDLAVFRFLCDLQHQGLRTELNFSIKNLIPGMEHYPRIQYKGIIISPETWLVPNNIVRSLKELDIDQIVKQLNEWFLIDGITSKFLTGNADQTLTFDPKNIDDLHAFSNYCKQNMSKPIYISEALLDSTGKVFNEYGQAYAAQYILSYVHHENIYQTQHDKGYKHGNYAVKYSIPPGRDWLYFEIYCHTTRSNDLLSRKLKDFINYHHCEINKWFFIRYNEPSSHLRIRIQLKDASCGYFLIADLQNTLSYELENGWVSDVQLKTYKKEIERYGIKNIDLVERYFHLDSCYALQTISRRQDTTTLYYIALDYMLDYIVISYKEIEQQLAFITRIANMFSKEFALNNDSFKVLNQSFRQLKKEQAARPQRRFKDLPPKKHRLLYANLIKSTQDPEEIFSLTADLLHLFVNRLFQSDQRMHEAILYQFLLKELARQHFFARQLEAPLMKQ